MRNKFVLIVISIFIIASAGCKRNEIPLKVNEKFGPDIFTESVITIKYLDKEYEIILHNDGTVSGNLEVFNTFDNYHYGKEKIYDSWNFHEKGRSVYVTNGSYKKYLYFFKNALVLNGGSNLKLDYKADFSDKLPEIVMEDIFSDDEIAMYKSLPFIRYVKPAEGAVLRASFTPDAEVIEKMWQGEPFFITETRNAEQTVDNKKVHWVSGYWRGIKGWVLDTELSEIPVKAEKRDGYLEGFKKCVFPNFKTTIYEQPDKSSRVIDTVITPAQFYYYAHEKGVPGWVFVTGTVYTSKMMMGSKSYSGYVEKDKITDIDQVDFQEVTKFRNITYKGVSWDTLYRYSFKTDGSCVKETYTDIEKEETFKEPLQLYRYKDIYCLKGGSDNKEYATFRFKNDVPCGLEDEDDDDNLNSKDYCEID